MDYTPLAHLLTLAGVLTLAVLLPESWLNRSVQLPQVRWFKVGGLRFVQVHRLSVSFCIKRKGS